MSKWIELKSIADLTVGFVGTMAKHYKNDGIPFLRSLNIKPFKIVDDDIKYISQKFCKKISKSILHEGDVVIVRTGLPGTCCVVPAEYDGCNCSDVVIVHPNTELVNAHYLAAFINIWGQRQIHNNKVGAIQQHFNVRSAEEMLIYLPEKEEQEKIAGVVVAINEKIESNNTICSELEAMAKTLYDYWFVQFDFPDENSKPYRTSGGEMVWNEQLKRKIPKGWKHIEYSELVDIENSSINPSSFGETLMEHYSIPAFDEDCMPAFDIAATIQSGKYKVLKESFLVSKLNPQFKRIWNPYCLTDNAICSTEFMVYKPKDITLRPICYAIANSDGFYNHMVSKAISSTGSRKRIQPDVSIQYSLAFPLDRFIVDRFCSHYSPIMEKIKKARLENYELKKLRDWLLPMLMNGQATVVDAEEDTGKVIPYTPQTVEVRQAARNFGDKETDDTADLVQAYLRRKQHDSKTQKRN